MLTPDQLASYPQELIALTAELNDRIIEDIGRRMAKLGRVLGTSEYQLDRLNELAAFDTEVQRVVSEYTNLSIREVNAMLADAAQTSVSNDIRMSGVQAVAFSNNPYLQQIARQIAETTEGTFRNLSGTMAFLDRNTGRAMGFRETLIRELDIMSLSVSEGLESYDQAIRRTVNKLGERGIVGKQHFYTTEKGTRVYRSVDTVVRQTCFGAMKAFSREQSKYNAALLGTDTFEITWHAGHRPSHGWGGMRYSISGSHGYPTQDQLYADNGGGTLGDFNCLHDEMAVDPASKPMYTREELRRLEASELETKTWQGKEYTRYEQQQQMRKYERDIRGVRREQSVAKHMMENATDETREQLTLNYYALKHKNNLMTQEYKQFANKMGLPVEMNRVYYDGLGRLGGKVPAKYLNAINRTADIDTIRQEIKTGIYPSRIVQGRQRKHIPGTTEFEQKRQSMNSKIDLVSFAGPTREPAILTADPRELFDKYHGKGNIEMGKSGAYPRETIIANEVVGQTWLRKFQRYMNTNTFVIQYSGAGVHLYPIYPE